MISDPTVIEAPNPVIALRELLELAEREPNVGYVVVNWSGEPVDRDVVNLLGTAFSDEKVVCAEPLQVPEEFFSKFYEKIHPLVVPQISSTVVAVRMSAIRTFMSMDIANSLLNVSICDFSVIINTVGFSSVKVPIPSRLMGALNYPIRGEWRDWDAYIEHSERVLRRNPMNFYTQFRNQLVAHSGVDVLIDASNTPMSVNGTSRVLNGFLEFITTAQIDGELDWQVTVIVDPGAITAFSKKFTNFEVITADDGLNRTYDLGISLTPVTSLERSGLLVTWCLKWVVISFDIIAARTFTHLSQQMHALGALKFAHGQADLLISISQSTVDDSQRFLSLESPTRHVRCYLGVAEDFGKSTIDKSGQDYSDRIVVLGNDEPHKQTQIAVRELLRRGFKVVSITRHNAISDDHLALDPGQVSDTELKRIISESLCVVFPSLYEGFGLPILEVSSLNKHLVIWDTNINREIISAFSIENVSFCNSISELASCVEFSLSQNSLQNQKFRTLNDFNKEAIAHISELLAENLNQQFAEKRWGIANLLNWAIEEQQSKFDKQLQAYVPDAPRNQSKLKRMLQKIIRSTRPSRLASAAQNSTM